MTSGKINLRDAIAIVLSAIAWFWTAYECDTIGIDVFDMLLKRFPGQLYLMAAVLTCLTFVWMRPHLITRAVMGIFMLAPGELFKLTRQALPEHGFAPVHVLVAFLYVLAVIGMYGMFYPWKIEKALGIGNGQPAEPAKESGEGS
ncbi:MAG: hypothetical protein J5807_03700 [Kiritimatiellae bacterium]|nr:hypothetical protein [Kiritimatiellia bacterium]